MILNLTRAYYLEKKYFLVGKKKKKKVKLVLFPASVILTLTFKLCKECHPKFSSIHTIALGSLSKSQPMLQQKTPQLNELFYCMSTENNKCPINPNSKHAKWKNRKTILVLQINYVYCCSLISTSQLSLEGGGTWK